MVSGYSLTTFPNAILAATTATKSKGKSNNKQQQTNVVHIQMRNKDCSQAKHPEDKGIVDIVKVNITIG